MQIIMTEAQDGMLLRAYLKSVLGISTKMLSRLKNDEEGIVVNGRRVTVRYVLHAGDVLSLMDGDREPGHVIPREIPVEILYEDDDVLLVNKAPDMPTHPSHGHLDDTLANALVYRYREMGIPFVFRPVSRLDRNTSGVVLVAKNKIAAARLDEAMREHRIRKTYLALLSGVPEPPAGRIETYICRTDMSIITRRVCKAEDAGAMYALTDYETALWGEKGAVVIAHPRTGRTHQLRVHFAHLGCPILGDDLYGEASEEIGRHALHALAVTFPHPSDGRRMTVTAPLPGDMLTAAEGIGISRSEAIFAVSAVTDAQNAEERTE